MQGKEKALQKANNTRRLGNQVKDRDLVINHIRSEVEKGTGLSLVELKKKYPEDVLFYTALQYVTTTKKALCTAMDIPVEAGCWYKRKFEKDGLLVQSVNEIICPYTKWPSHFISTNPDEFQRLGISKSNQISLF